MFGVATEIDGKKLPLSCTRTGRKTPGGTKGTLRILLRKGVTHKSRTIIFVHHGWLSDIPLCSLVPPPTYPPIWATRQYPRLRCLSLCSCVPGSGLESLKQQHSRTKPPHPSGPIRYPLIGSFLGVPRDPLMWKLFDSIAKKFSRCSTPVGGHPTEDATVLRHRHAIPEVLLNGRCPSFLMKPFVHSC